MTKSLCSRVPGKLILFGEWAVLKGHACVGLPLTGDFVTQAFLHDTNSVTSKNSDLDHPQHLLTANSWVRRVWAQLARALPMASAYRFECHRSWALHEGLGSSSALFLSLVEIREQILEKTLTWPELKILFSSIENNHGSGMDLAIQRTRSTIVYENFLPTKIPKFVWPENLILLHGTRKQNTCDAIKTVTCTTEQSSALGKSSKNFSRSTFASNDWIKAMTEHCEVLQDMNVVPKEAMELWATLKNEACLRAIKSVGAGGMDGLLVWSDDPKKFTSLSPALRELGWYLSPHKATS